MAKIKVKNPIVEIDGDEMTRVIWAMIKEKLIIPYLDVDLKYFDLQLKKRDETDDKITIDAAKAIEEFGVGVKCATITPDANRVKEYGLKRQWKSPNGQIRAYLDGTVFREPIMVKNIKPFVRTWKKPIIVGRHAYGDLYKNVEIAVGGAGKAELVFKREEGHKTTKATIYEFDGPGVVMGIYNTEKSIRSFAQACIRYAIDRKVNLWFAAKDTISKTYHAAFKGWFAEEIINHHEEIKKADITYNYYLIDDAVARVMKHEGGILWAMKNYDGDIFSDMIAAGFGSLGMMTSVLVSPLGKFEYEAAHGTVMRHYHKHLKGEETSTNSVATMFAWSGAIKKRGELDNTPEVVKFGKNIEKAVIGCIESGIATKDLIPLMNPKPKKYENTQGFIDQVNEKLQNLMS